MVAVRQEPPGQPELDISNVIAAFSEDQVERITGLNKGRLRYWARTDFFRPSFVEDNLRLAYSRFYSFKDIVALRTLEVLRIQHSVPLQHLRKVAEKLDHLKDELWTKTSLFVVSRRVIFQNPETGKPQEVVSGQYLLSIKLKKIISDTRNDVITLNQRSSDSIGKIRKHRSIARNAWSIAGTRITVGSIKRFHEDGYSVDQIVEEYPDLTGEDVHAALAHDESQAA